MKVISLVIAFIATASAFSITPHPGVHSPKAAKTAETPLARTFAPELVVLDHYDKDKAWIRIPGDKWVDFKELTPLYVVLGTLFFCHDYMHFQLGMFPGDPL